MRSAGLSPFNNNWSNIHDFTPSSDNVSASRNYQLVSDVALATAKVGLNEPETTGEMDSAANFDPTSSLIPHTVGHSQRKIIGEVRTRGHFVALGRLIIILQTAAVLIFTENNSSHLARNFVKFMQSDHPGLHLSSTKDVTVSAGNLQRILRTNAYAVQCAQGQSIIEILLLPGMVEI